MESTIVGEHSARETNTIAPWQRQARRSTFVHVGDCYLDERPETTCFISAAAPNSDLDTAGRIRRRWKTWRCRRVRWRLSWLFCLVSALAARTTIAVVVGVGDRGGVEVAIVGSRAGITDAKTG